MPIGAEPQEGGGVSFRVWAPRCSKVDVVLDDKDKAGGLYRQLASEGHGYFSGIVGEASTGTLYRFRLDGGAALFPDPASRFQPDGPNGPSQVVDPDAFPWTDGNWRGVGIRGQVMYEMHIGTYTPRARGKAPDSGSRP